MDPGRNPGSEGSEEECKRDEVSVSNLSTDPINPTEAIGRPSAKGDAFVRGLPPNRAGWAPGGAAGRPIRVVNGCASSRSTQEELLSDEEELARTVSEVSVDRSCIEHDQLGPYGVRGGRAGVDTCLGKLRRTPSRTR